MMRLKWIAFRKSRRAQSKEDYETWERTDVSNTINLFDIGDVRSTNLLVKMKKMIMLENHPNDSRVKIDESGKCQTLTGRMGQGGGNLPMILETLSVKQEIEEFCKDMNDEVDHQQDLLYSESGKMGTLCPGTHASGSHLTKTIQVKESDNEMSTVVRRLTPLECERLQGFPDGWTDIGEWMDTKGKLHKESSDSARFKSLGNSIALPQWFWISQKLKPILGDGATLGSLFDGIGGFPLVWEETYGKGTAKWASEIEEFPIAVTKRHFGKEEGMKK